MSFREEIEAPIYHLLSHYNNEALTHGAWLASFIISIFAFISLTFRTDTPWGWGSFIVLCVLGFLSSYVFGRLIYYAKLVTCLTTRRAVGFFPTPIRDVVRNVQKIFEQYVKAPGKKSPLWWFAWQFRSSFRISSLVLSTVLGVSLAFCLLWLRFLVSICG